MSKKQSLTNFIRYNIENTQIYAPEQTKELCNEILQNLDYKIYKYRGGGKVYAGARVYNIPIAFDIETSSFYEGKEKRACMYMWQMSVCGLIIIGRTWDEWLETLETLHQEFKTYPGDLHLLFYIQNLQYEFQWFCKRLEWLEVFAIDNRKPVHALCSLGIEFKCSYVLSAFSLAKMGEHLTEIPVHKTDGLEYYELRHSNSTLTWDNIRYGVNDVQVVVSFIYEEIIKNGTITKIPLTNTGYVRAFCRKACLQGFDNNAKRRAYQRFRYLDFIHGLTLEQAEYEQARRCFAGGYTHTSPFWAELEVWDFWGKDFTSAYPAIIVLLANFAMSKAEYIEEVTPEIFEESLNLYFCMFDVIIEDLDATFLYDNYISYSRAWITEGCTTSNGRVVKAKRIGLTVCGADWQIIKRTYKWKEGGCRVGHLRRYKKGYLPTDFVKAVLSLYADKTTLKGVKGKEIEYQQKKGMCNATFGMSCQAVYKDNNIFDDGEWKDVKADALAELEKYNTSKNRFLFYIWALTITAECRKNLWSAILECGADYIYSDTDSIKYLNPQAHQAYFDAYNNRVMKLIEQSSKFHRIPIEQYMPKTIDGKVKIIGVWDDDGKYMCGKFLRAKCYLLQKWDGTLSLTASGLNKKITLPYLEEKYGRFIFDNFDNKLYIPKGKTGKLVHTYIDYETQGKITDYEGVEGYYHELSSIHLEEGDYHLDIDDFIEYLLTIRETD